MQDLKCQKSEMKMAHSMGDMKLSNERIGQCTNEGGEKRVNEYAHRKN